MKTFISIKRLSSFAVIALSVTSWSYAGTIGQFVQRERGPQAVAARPNNSLTSCDGSAGTTSFVGAKNNKNFAAGGYSVVGGGDENVACESYSSVLGGYNNIVSTSFGGPQDYNLAPYSSIAGGRNNAVGSYESFIGGGSGNIIQLAGSAASTSIAYDSSILGGQMNTIEKGARYAAIGGGTSNTISAEFAFIGSGSENVVNGKYGFVGGGYENEAGANAVVPGGEYNVANGMNSFAGGYKSQANFPGSFVWSDYTGTKSLQATVPNEFLARASSGVIFYSNPGQTCGVRLAPGGGAWEPLSTCAAQTSEPPGGLRAEIAELRTEIAGIKADNEALKAQVRALVAARR
jgi:hypothetical protein